jgi:hypothetical protein
MRSLPGFCSKQRQLTRIVQISLNRILELNFENCVGCAYRWKLRSNPFTDRIKVGSKLVFLSKSGWNSSSHNFCFQSVGKKYINSNGISEEDLGILGSQGVPGKTSYLFSAFKPGIANLMFEYGYKMPISSKLRLTHHC